MTDIRVAIISFEHMHAFSYAAAFKRINGASLVAIADSSPDRLKQVQSDFPFVGAFYGDYVAMLEHSEIDAVIIASPNSEHKEIAVECAQRKKHIMCEKPLATTIADAREIISAAQTSGVKLMTAFPVRFSPPIERLRSLVQNGKLGRVLGAATSNHGSMPGSWFVDAAKSGGGAVIDHTVHVADAMRWVLDDEVESVYAEYDTRLHDLKVDDVGQLLMRFRKGTIVSLDTSWSRPKSYSIWGDVKIEMKGTEANVNINCFPQQINLFSDESMRHSGYNSGVDLDLLMIEEFLSAIREDRAPRVTGEDGLKAVEIALAAYEAGRTRKAVQLV